ncbi:cilia- and flagella-associated protein 221-like [Ylistrum balloti]|uniref:cilia- and flagella-associated protein 221-like n=1 Tax=Ylistrum balloti TaxID=509963 RepID=UPI002905F082|nr:cilia- and flagella-associated protein 221-like [Ylistrum balloti]
MPAVTAMNRAFTDPVGLSGEKGLLIDTMQLVEPKAQQPVPNHLLETKIYSTVAQNAMVQAKPAVVHFGGYTLHKKQVQTLSIVNASTEVIRMHIIPPQTKYFYLKYKKSERLVPGLTIECTIEFTPDEWRYYYDCIRINCPGEENLVIPIHAYPVMSTEDFPQQFSFPPVPVGHKMTKVFPLRCDAPIDFEFNLTYIQPHPSFSVQPMTGVIPAHGESEVSVTFAPLEFLTAMMKIQLVISQFNSKPIICNFCGTSLPGMLKEISEQQYESEEILDPRSLTPLGRSRKKRQKVKPRKTKEPEEVEYGGVRFPPQLDTPYAVAQVLNQEPGKLRAKDLRETVITKSKDKPKAATRQMKEAVFEHSVRQNVYEERQNQLRWQVKFGDDQITNAEREKILVARKDAWDQYKYERRGDPIPEDEYGRQETASTFKRTFRESTTLALETAKFDTYTNDLWAVRHAALERFSQAGRKVILHARVNHKLNSLRKMVEDWRKEKFSAGIVSQERKDKVEDEEQKEMIPANLPLHYSKVKRHQFVTYSTPNVKDDMAPDALGKVPFTPTNVVVKRKVPYFQLKVPQQYKIQGYRHHDVHSASGGYVAPKLARPLRTGAEEEVITVTDTASAVTQMRSSMTVDTEEREVPVVETSEEVKIKPVPLIAPSSLFQPVEYPSLHIFNPSPGLQVFQSPMPYAEVDSDFHLCPLPRYFRADHATNPHAATQRKYLDREDVIRGIMAWKKFPSQGLTSLTNTPTLTNVWVPRWDDPFGGEMLPASVPSVLDSLPEDDKKNIEEEDTEDDSTATTSVILTPGMVNAQFPVLDPNGPSDEKISVDTFPYGNKLPTTNIPVSSNGPVPREKREQEMEYFMNKKYNRLGAKIQARTTTLNLQVTDPNILLQ